MTHEQRKAHLRLMSLLPCHTNHAALPMERMNGKRIGGEIEPLIAEARELLRQGKSRREIVKIMHIGQGTYRRLRLIIESCAARNG